MQRSQFRTLILTVLLAIALLVASVFSHYRNSSIGELPAQAVEATYTTSEQTAIPTLAYTNGQQQVLAPDWSKITWGNLPPIEESGWIQIPENLVKKLGYNPSRVWQAGDHPDQFTFLGDVQDALHPEAFKLEDISGITGLAMNTLNLNDFGLMNWQTPKSLVKAIPALANLPIEEVAPLRDLLQITGGGGAGSIAQLLRQNPTFALLPLGKLGLDKYNLQSMPGLEQIPLGKFTGWQQSAITSIPGLNQVPFNLFPQSILGGVGVVGIADVVWSAAEHGDANVGANQFVSGTVNKKNQTIPVACTAGKPCVYLELSDPAGANAPLHGKRWASGKSQKVKGGFGVLGKVNNGWEPAGKLVYGPAFKVVMLDTNESTGSASFGLYLRFCSRGLVDLGCTPYFVGPIPWIPVKEKGALIVAGVSTPKVKIPSKYQEQLEQLRQQYEPQAYPDENGAFDDCIAGTVSGDAVNRAIAAAPTGLRSYANKTVPLVLAAAKKYGVTDPAQVAYILSTVQTETTMGANLVEGATRNKSAPGSTYYGRGLVQLTGIDNYRKASSLVGVDLVKSPERATQPEIAAKILVVGMRDGMFTGRKLSDFIRDGKADFVGARQIVNDSDKQFEMAQNAQRYLASIQGTSIATLKESSSTCATNVASGPIQQRIYQAAKDSYGMDSSRSGLPGGGNVACAWAVNRVLNQAGISTVGSNPNLVFSVRDALEAGRGQEIKARSQAQAGDLALALGSGNKQHIGICMNDGCTQVISNSSSRQSFTWKSDTDFGGYYGVPSKIYRVVK
jgi:hypothetical protein